jgi:hypothetical protein
VWGRLLLLLLLLVGLRLAEGVQVVRMAWLQETGKQQHSSP